MRCLRTPLSLLLVFKVIIYSLRLVVFHVDLRRLNEQCLQWLVWQVQDPPRSSIYIGIGILGIRDIRTIIFMVGIRIGYLTILQTIDKIRLFVNRHGELILKQGDIRIKKQGTKYVIADSRYMYNT